MDFSGPAVIVLVDVPGTQAVIAGANAATITGYHNDVSNWLLRRSGSPGLAPPPPILIEQLDAQVLANDFLAFNAMLATRRTAVFSMADSVISLPYPPDARIAAALTVAPPPAQPDDPVGEATGNGYYADKPGDQNPVGAVVSDSRGRFVKIGGMTPFGEEVAYIKVS